MLGVTTHTLSTTIHGQPAENSGMSSAVMSPTPMPSVSLLSLPLHLVARVLVELGAVQHLPPVLISHPIFYATFAEFPSLVYDILRAQLRVDDLFVLALLAHESHPARRARAAHQFVRTYRDDPHSLVASHRFLRLTEALHVGELHGAVCDLRDDFLRRTLPRLYAVVDLDGVAGEHEASVAELRRVERALYRFHMYCCLFSHAFRNSASDYESKAIFFDQYPSWVNEQLGCVYDYLELQLDEALDQVTTAMGDDAKLVAKGGRQHPKQQYLSLGLPFHHRLFQASTIDDKYEVLRAATVFLSPNVPTPSSVVQNKEKHREQSTPSEWNIDVKELCRDHDDDEGPRNMWDASHTSKPSMFFTADHEVALRRLGYVMWDQRRVAEDACRETLAVARQDSTATHISKWNLMSVAMAWDKQIRVPGAVKHGPDCRCRLESVAMASDDFC